ncbi:hypothetical protein [Phyllobacterium endophyticum]|jgi:hypothetical protein|uniref:Uncharacterized protein n=1 Tax=Phyllobacterium endophyticum TaxID=1149773 RepID=A0A2P7AVM2_9HYPH|nr:hypothetical protein [Phyllobacterium endophyticum]MBB3234795.1 hypothetical protein [Phyllobacterium endophyticum]PSH58233.1 hypothetical protein CU100_11435 [Phyllobacterium endophyticum]TXR50724.1 hypothetical protein FVA77_02550 [Phyllobacterium endophyticum]TYR38913.1 hypothetical protein FY050_23370 [Phyllobacterium endophyticum]
MNNVIKFEEALRGYVYLIAQMPPSPSTIQIWRDLQRELLSLGEEIRPWQHANDNMRPGHS